MPNRKKTVLVVVPHADDMEFMAAGTVARFVDECDYDVFEYILTDNSRGSFKLATEELIRVSEREAIEAGKILGLKEVRFERYRDGDLNEIHPNVLREKIMSMIREVRADIVMSWDPFAPYEDHPDHRIGAMATLEAASFAGNPKFHPEHAHAPYPVSEAYWFAKTPYDDADKLVDISFTIDKKIDALLAHDCQIEFTLDAIVQHSRVVGADEKELKKLLARGHKRIIGDAIREYCAAMGEEAEYHFAELFRYERLGLLHKIFDSDLVEEDFYVGSDVFDEPF